MFSVRTLPALFATLILATSLAAAPADARKRYHRANSAPVARTANYDGNWSVLIVTSSGQCDRGYRYGVTIRGGRVFYEGGAPVNVDGAVSGNGAVQVRLSAGSQRASGAGRLGSSSGGGTWRGESSSGSCAGTWTAERRG